MNDNKNNIKILIMGRTGSGKDYLASLLKKEGLTQVLSYTTRPKRRPDENTHIFISKEEADAIPAEDKVATTVINGYEYFATRQQVGENDIYIIDPKGFYELKANMPDTAFLIIYVDAVREEAMARAQKRAADPEKEREIFESRYESEDEQFTAFEETLNKEYGTPMTFIRITNDYAEDGVLADTAKQVLAMRRTFAHLLPAVRAARKADLLYLTEDDKIIVYTEGGEEHVSDDVFTERLLTGPEGVGRLMLSLLSRPDICLAEGFGAELAQSVEAEDVTGYFGEALEVLPATEENTETRFWFHRLYNKAAKYLDRPLEEEAR